MTSHELVFRRSAAKDLQDIPKADVKRILPRFKHGHMLAGVAQIRHAVTRPTTRRTHGATIATVGKATGHVVIQLLSHCAGNPGPTPRETASTKADTMQTMMAESRALNSIGAKRAGIRIFGS